VLRSISPRLIRGTVRRIVLNSMALPECHNAWNDQKATSAIRSLD
jgi:hypothetical protein